MKKFDLKVGEQSALEIWNIYHGILSPLQGFLNSKDYRSVVEEMHLTSGAPWTIPVTLDVPEENLSAVKAAEVLKLKDDEGQSLADLQIEDVFRVDIEKDSKKIFGVNTLEHPGVNRESKLSPYRVGGKLIFSEGGPVRESLPYDLTPAEAKKTIQNRGWKKVVGFQTRNPIHRAHEYLQRIALEVADGVLIHPLVGWKKKGDFAPTAVLRSYEVMIDSHYPKDRVLLGLLRTPMRYAGPREAVFHALVRKNFGCTHFIVGRDHAGVGGYYGLYDAQNLAKSFDDLGIEILALQGPYYCQKCQGVVTQSSCGHRGDSILEISGTLIRKQLSTGSSPPDTMMRQEVSEVLLNELERGTLFI